VLLKVSKWLLVLALCFSIGAHWAILQTVAWCGMAVSYSQGSSIKEGLAKTFDGEHPCKFCKLIAEAKKNEKKQEAQPKVVRLDLFSDSGPGAFYIPGFRPVFLPSDSTFFSRTETPLTPPPRAA